MTYPIFNGTGDTRIDTKNKRIAQPQDYSTFHNPQDYQCSEALADAVNIALLMNQPLFITGEPGAGKTQLANRLAWELKLNLIKFETKSTTTAQDLFYTYNTLTRFHAAHQGKDVDERDFITYQGLGEAIIQANPLEKIKDILPKKGFKYKGPTRSVVLIDEIDKAPRDFPNDILNELELMFFKIPQLDMDEPIKPPKKMSPIVIMTSNTEKQMPDAFLRRCVFHYIEFPELSLMKDIIQRRLPRIAEQSSEFIKDAIDLFYQLRDDQTDLIKKPSTGELLIWINVM
ncbi:ATPase family associated with various cellular activities (AAA), partial [Candidatus Magnetomorum sp. HK-1]